MQKRKRSLSPNRGGRPSLKQAGQIEDKILDAAAALFFEEGYGAASIEDIARRAQCSKRTFYARYDSKGAVFKAVVHRMIERLRPANRSADEIFSGDNLEEILRRIGRLILQATLQPETLGVHRVVLAEAVRFPELALIMHEQGSRQEAIRRLAALLHKHHSGGIDPSFAAEQFLQMITSAPQRRALGFGTPLKSGDYGAWVDATVRLFLKGYATI